MSSTRRRNKANLLTDEQQENIVTIRESKPPPATLIFFIGCVFFVLLFVLIILVSSLLSFALMDSYTWGYQIQDIKEMPIVSIFFPPVKYRKTKNQVSSDSIFTIQTTRNNRLFLQKVSFLNSLGKIQVYQFISV